jgi:hypothetical protein
MINEPIDQEVEEVIATLQRAEARFNDLANRVHRLNVTAAAVQSRNAKSEDQTITAETPPGITRPSVGNGPSTD